MKESGRLYIFDMALLHPNRTSCISCSKDSVIMELLYGVGEVDGLNDRSMIEDCGLGIGDGDWCAMQDPITRHVCLRSSYWVANQLTGT